MSAPDFEALERQLLKSGVAPVNARRAASELEDHYCDLVESALESGAEAQAASNEARRALGDLADIHAAIAAEDSLKGWAWRWPRVALVVYPVAFVLALPAVPVYAGIRNAPLIGRWLTCLALSGIVTVSMFLFLQLAIMAS